MQRKAWALHQAIVKLWSVCHGTRLIRFRLKNTQEKFKYPSHSSALSLPPHISLSLATSFSLTHYNGCKNKSECKVHDFPVEHQSHQPHTNHCQRRNCVPKLCNKRSPCVIGFAPIYRCSDFTPISSSLFNHRHQQTKSENRDGGTFSGLQV